MKQQMKNLIERVLIARPAASPDEIRNLVPALRDKSEPRLLLHSLPKPVLRV
ncbi:MAG: hypothetical protein LC676_13950 [Loktanella sp.]|nr:hypothetical protein [Loktanella sp.]